MPNFRSLGAPPPDPHAYGGWRLCLQTPIISLGRLGAPPPDPQTQPHPLRISGNTPAYGATFVQTLEQTAI